MKKRICFAAMLIMMLGIFSYASVAAEESVVFYDAADDSQITEIGSAQSVWAKISFTAPKDGTASVVAASYSKTGTMCGIAVFDSVTMQSGETVEYTTPDIPVSDTDVLKLFVWDGMDSMIPVLSAPGMLKKSVPKETFALVFENTARYIYRVGNENPVALGSLFQSLEGVTIDSSQVVVSVETNAGDAASALTPDTADWTNGTIQFTGEGIVTVTIQEGENIAKTLQLEVVNGYNVTSYAELANRNSVLLNDITMASGGTIRFTDNVSVYGNGFTFDVTNGAYTKPGYDSSSYVVYLENSNLNNIRIVGAVYTKFGATRSDDYNRAIVLTAGDCTIANSYISNGASPVRNGGRLELVNTTLQGGIYANLDHRSGQLILDNVTTINQVPDNDIAADGTVVVGLGIVVYQEGGTEAINVTIKNDLHQYNYLSKAQADTYITDTNAVIVKNIIFSSDYAQYHYDDGTDTWLNTGIISMNDYISAEDIIDERAAGTHSYVGMATVIDISNQTRACYVYTPKPDEIKTAPAYVRAGQYEILPVPVFDYTDKNYIENTGDTNRYCYEEDGLVYISMNEGEEPVLWDTSILTVTKHGKTLEYQVTQDGVDITGKTLEFDTTGDYTLVYTYTDPYNYKIGESGLAETYSKTYTRVVYINVAVKKDDAKNAVFTFGAKDETTGTGMYTAKTVTVNSTNYIMPDVDAAVDGKIGSKTVDGITVYYPITEMFTSNGSNEHSGTAKWYACFPIFQDAVWIVDYEDAGTGDELRYNQETVTTVAAIPEKLVAVNPQKDFLYQMSAATYPPPGDKYMLNDIVCYTCNRNGLTNTNTRTEQTVVAEYKYQDNAGKTYIYYVGYHCAAQTNSNSCVTGDTLVSLADGTQKRIDAVTYDDVLKVWDFEKGEYTAAPAAVIRNHGLDYNTVITLQFSDGTVTRVVNEHGYYDAELQKFVAINGDSAEDYIGHSFVKETASGYQTVILEDVTVEKEYIETWSLLTDYHYNFITDGIFSISSSIRGLEYFMPFAYGVDLKIDAEKMQADIEKYGLYTYEEFEDILTPEQFRALNMPQIKVSVGKGIISWDDLLEILRIEVLTL